MAWRIEPEMTPPTTGGLHINSIMVYNRNSMAMTCGGKHLQAAVSSRRDMTFGAAILLQRM